MFGFKVPSFWYQSPVLTEPSTASDAFPLLGSSAHDTACHTLGTQRLKIYNLQVWLFWVCPRVWSSLCAGTKFNFGPAQPRTINSPRFRQGPSPGLLWAYSTVSKIPSRDRGEASASPVSSSAPLAFPLPPPGILSNTRAHSPPRAVRATPARGVGGLRACARPQPPVGSLPLPSLPPPLSSSSAS